jgi:hypothetical protein
MRTKFRTIGIAIGILLMLLVQSSARADSFSFSFQGPTDSGSGTFFTSSPPDRGCGYAGISSCYYIRSITGELDGQPITEILPLGDQYAAVTTDGQFETLTGLGFVVNSQYWDLSCTTLGGIPCSPDQTALSLVTYYDPFYEYSVAAPEPVTLTIAPIPEPSTLLLLGTGLLCLAGLFKNKLG